METILLTNQQPEFTIWGREEKMNAEILKILIQTPLPAVPLHLEVLDENGLLLYTKPLIPRPILPDEVPVKPFPEVPVNKRFIFNALLRVRIVAPENTAFRAEVQFL